MIRRTTCAVSAMLALSGCKIGQQIVSGAPPAMAPVIALQNPVDIESGSVGVTRWPGEDPFYVYAERRSFTLILKSGQVNKIEFTAGYGPVSTSAQPIASVSPQTVQANNARWTYVVSNLQPSTTDKTQTARYTFYSPVAGPDTFQDGRSVWIRAKEESNNPAFRNKPAQFAESVFEIVPVAAGGCTVTAFRVTTGLVETKIVGCKEYYMDGNGGVIRHERTRGLRATFPPDPTPSYGHSYVYTGQDIIRLVAVDAVRRETLEGKDGRLNPAVKPPCMTSTYVDNADGMKTRFRLPC